MTSGTPAEGSSEANNKNKYLLNCKFLTDTERLKKLEPIMRECGVVSSYSVKEKYIDGGGKYKEQPAICVNNTYKSFDHADIESVLPDECFSLDLFNSIYNNLAKQDTELHNKICELLEAIRHTRGQTKLEYMADLAILLYDNGIELRSHKTKKVER